MNFSVLCSALKPSLTPTLNAINLDSNAIAHILGDPFEYCKNLTSISIANNQIERLPSGMFCVKIQNEYLYKENWRLLKMKQPNWPAFMSYLTQNYSNRRFHCNAWTFRTMHYRSSTEAFYRDVSTLLSLIWVITR